MLKYYRNNDVTFDGPVLTAGATTITLSGEIGWYKEGVVGYAYKKSSESVWNYKPTGNIHMSGVEITGLTPSTSYDVCLYIKFDGHIRKGEKVVISTTAE